MSTYLQHHDAARLAFELSVGAYLVGELLQVLRVRRGAVSVGLAVELAFRVAFFAAVLCLPLGNALAPHAVLGGGAAVLALGFLIGWIGLLLRWWSILTLGPYFTVVLTATGDQPVIDRGPYRVLRHPSYTGLLLAFVGAGLIFGNWLGLAASATVLLIALAHRIRIEERTLSAALGEAYQDFAASRSRLVPFVW